MDGFALTTEGGTLAGSLGGAAPGLCTVNVAATDGKGGAPATASFALEILDVNEAPQANPAAAYEPYFGDVGTAIDPISLADFTTAFTDPNGDALTLSATGLPAGLRVVDGRIVGALLQNSDFGRFTSWIHAVRRAA